MRQIPHAMLAAACAACLTLLSASGASAAGLYYQVTDLSGSNGAGNSINNRGWVSGFSTAGNGAIHATLWPGDTGLDLGTLGVDTLNSAVLWPVKNNNGLVVGISESDLPDPNNAAWSCAGFIPRTPGRRCVGFAWRNEAMVALPALGGYNSFATGANNQGEIVGWAENATPDPTCIPPQVLQFQAVIWAPRSTQPHQLLSLPGDSTSAATALNDSGSVVGISGICGSSIGRFSAAHAVLWHDDTVTDLGTLGGVAWNTPMAINQDNVVVGFANVPGGATPGSFRAHAFRWTAATGMEDLHAFGDDVYSQALGINGKGQIVGLSCSAGFASCRAVLWQDGTIIDLNARVAPGYAGYLYYANDIDDAGRIAGLTLLPDGSTAAFRAMPVAAAAAADARAMQRRSLPEGARRDLLRRFGVEVGDLAR